MDRQGEGVSGRGCIGELESVICNCFECVCVFFNCFLYTESWENSRKSFPKILLFVNEMENLVKANYRNYFYSTKGNKMKR